MSKCIKEKNMEAIFPYVLNANTFGPVYDCLDHFYNTATFTHCVLHN